MLKLEEVLPYIPYGVDFKISDYELHLKARTCLIDNVNPYSLIGFKLNDGLVSYCALSDVKPILRPFAEFVMIEEIMDEFSLFELELIHNSFFATGTRSLNCLDRINLTQAQLMFKHHIDVFGLIGRGLAYDINKI